MRGFLRFIGVLLLFVYFAGIIIYAVNVPFRGLYIFYFVLYIIFGPTLAVILFAIARIIDNIEVNEIKIDKINKKVDLLVDKLIDNPELKRKIFENNNDDKISF